MATALITGGSGGIGLEIAKIFAKEGVNLILVARDMKKLKHAQDLLKNKKLTIEIISLDLSVLKNCDYLFKKYGGRVDYLVNNAGFGSFGYFKDDNIETQNKMINLNILSLTYLTKLFLPSLQKKCGKILNVASTAGFIPIPKMCLYSATKAFVLNFTEALAVELRNSGITVTALCPGPTHTGFAGRAHASNSSLFKKNVLSASYVAKMGYRGMMNGKTTVVTGSRQKLMLFLAKLTPRCLVPRIAGRFL